MKKKVLIWACVLLIPLTGLLAIPNMVESSIPSIYYVTPMVKTYENIVNCTGVVQPEYEYCVYAAGAFVPGAVHVELGDIVSEGQTLMSVDKAASDKLNRGLGGTVLEDVSSGISRAVPELDLPALFSAYGLAGFLGGGVDLGQVLGEMQAEAPQAQGQSVAVLADADYGDVTAPAFGMVTEIHGLAGSPVSAGKALFTIQDIKSYKVVASVAEGEIANIREGDKAVVRGVGFSGTSFSGHVSKIYPTAHKTLSGTATETVVDVEILLDNPNNKLKSGFSAKVEIVGGQRQELITVPYEAIRQDENNNEYVYVYEDGKLKKAPIITGKELINEVEVLEGLDFESVVIYNPDDVQGEGTIVNLKGRAEIA